MTLPSVVRPWDFWHALLLAIASLLQATLAAAAWKVVSVHDGDTLRAIDQANVQHKIRLAGIDAPELGQPHGRASRDRLGDLVVGQTAAAVELHDRDRCGRDLATLVIDGTDVNRQLLAEGLAWHFTRYGDGADLAAAEAVARAARSGLWADKAPVALWDWRAGEAERKTLDETLMERRSE